MLSFPVPVLSFLFVSFRPSLIRFPQLFLRCFPYALALGIFRFPSGFFRPLLFRLRLLGLLCFLSSFFPFPPHSGFSGAPLPLTLSQFSPFFPAWFPMLSFPVLRTRLPVRFLSSFPVSLPQLFHRCFPFALAFGLSLRFPLSFVHFCLVLTTQPSVLSFPFFPFSPVGGSFGAVRFLSSPSFSSSVRPVSMPLFRFRYSAFCCSFQPSLSRLTVLPQRLDLILSVSAAPLCFRFRFVYSAWMSFSQGHPFAPDLRPPRTLLC